MLRAAFDFGSGATKLCLAEVVASTPSSIPTSVQILYEEEADVLLGHSYKSTPDGSIDDATCQKLFSTVERFLDVIKSESGGRPVTMAGVATATYREAKNGAHLLKTLSDRYRIPAEVISQEEEGNLGFATALIKTKERLHLVERLPAKDFSSGSLLGWDSGGSSFQIVHGDIATQKVKNIFEGKWGSSKAVFAMAKDIQGKSGQGGEAAQPNPVSIEDFDRFVSHVRKAVREQAMAERGGSLDEWPPKWLNEAVTAQCSGPAKAISCIGGPTCAFRMCGIAMRDTVALTAADIEQVTKKNLCGKTDAELSALGFPQASMVVPKIGLVVAVMQELQLPCFTVHQTTGTTAGMLISPRYWMHGGDKSSKL